MNELCSYIVLVIFIAATFSPFNRASILGFRFVYANRGLLLLRCVSNVVRFCVLSLLADYHCTRTIVDIYFI